MANPDMSRARWRKSSRSGQNGNCVEVAAITGVVAVRDSKNPGNPSVVLPVAEWRALLGEMKAGRYDLA